MQSSRRRFCWRTWTLGASNGKQATTMDREKATRYGVGFRNE